MVRHYLPVILSLTDPLPTLDGVEQGLPLRQTRHTSFRRLSQFGASLEVFHSVSLGVAGKCAAEFLGPELGGTDRLSADALRGRHRTRCPLFSVSSSLCSGDAISQSRSLRKGEDHSHGNALPEPASQNHKRSLTGIRRQELPNAKNLAASALGRCDILRSPKGCRRDHPSRRRAVPRLRLDQDDVRNEFKRSSVQIADRTPRARKLTRSPHRLAHWPVLIK